MYVCAVGACGYAGETKFGGNSLLVNPLGEEIVHLSAEEEVAVGEADFSIIKNVRDTINVFRDRRPETYEIN
jgi:predicted amidohydrolase